jgi:transposase-like protein
VRVAGKWVYLYRAVDSAGETIDFMLSPKRDLVAAKHFLQLALWHTRAASPRVINVDGHPAYARDRRPEAIRRVGKEVPLPAVAVHEQYRRWLAKNDLLGQVTFIHGIFGIAA